MPKPAQKPKTIRDVLDGVVSAAIVPYIDQLMKSIAKAVPEDSPARNPILLRAVDGFLGYVENKTDRLPPVIGTLAEKGVNGLTLLSALLTGNVGVEKHENAPDIKTDVLMKEAQKKILAAKTKEEVTAALLLLEQQLAAIKSFGELLKPPLDPDAAPKNAIPHRDIREVLREDVTPRLKSWREQLEAAAARRNGG